MTLPVPCETKQTETALNTVQSESGSDTLQWMRTYYPVMQEHLTQMQESTRTVVPTFLHQWNIVTQATHRWQREQHWGGVACGLSSVGVFGSWVWLAQDPMISTLALVLGGLFCSSGLALKRLWVNRRFWKQLEQQPTQNAEQEALRDSVLVEQAYARKNNKNQICVHWFDITETSAGWKENLLRQILTWGEIVQPEMGDESPLCVSLDIQQMIVDCGLDKSQDFAVFESIVEAMLEVPLLRSADCETMPLDKAAMLLLLVSWFVHKGETENPCSIEYFAKHDQLKREAVKELELLRATKSPVVDQTTEAITPMHGVKRAQHHVTVGRVPQTF